MGQQVVQGIDFLTGLKRYSKREVLNLVTRLRNPSLDASIIVSFT